MLTTDKRIERRMLATISSLTATCFFLLLLAGCGGNSNKQAAGVGNVFAGKALAVREVALESKHGWQPFPVADFDPSNPDVSRFPEVSTWLAEQVAPTFDTWLNELQALGTPPAAAEAWSATLAAVKKIDQLNAVQIAAANKRDADAFVAADVALEAIQPRLVDASEKAGIADGADVHAA